MTRGDESVDPELQGLASADSVICNIFVINRCRWHMFMPFWLVGLEGGITQNSLRAVLSPRASPLTRLGAKSCAFY